MPTSLSHLSELQSDARECCKKLESRHKLITRLLHLVRHPRYDEFDAYSKNNFFKLRKPPSKSPESNYAQKYRHSIYSERRRCARHEEHMTRFENSQSL